MTKRLINLAIWSILVLLSAYYFYRGIRFRFFEEGIGNTFWNKQFWYVFHIATAIASLLLGPIQSWSKFRINYPRWHRRLGRIYIIGSLLSGIAALYLSFTIQYEGSKLPLVLALLLWLFMTSAAWYTILHRNIKSHRLFMIRSYVLALTFVWIRIIDDIPGDIKFFFIQSQEVRDTTQEWVSWVLPLLIMEFILTWRPLLKVRK